jgi:3-hydroxyisobutyrate dehydrogenase-like beta-hydroxyacid dehydrogenase
VEKQALVFIGLGGMGSAMAHRLIDGGYELTVYNRDHAKARPLAERGASVAATPADAAAAAGVVLLSLSDEAAVEQIVFTQLGHSLRPGLLVIDTSTVSPGYSRDLTGRLGAAGVQRVEACVLGNPDLARAGGLRLLAAGEAAGLDAAAPVLEALSAEVIRLGDAGTAAVMKLAFNLLIGAQIASLAEAVRYGEQAAGLNRAALLTAIERSGFCSRVMGFRAAIMREGRYEPAAFRATLMDKDLRLALGDAAAYGLTLPVTAASQQRFGAMLAAGTGDLDAAAVVEESLDPEPSAGQAGVRVTAGRPS